MYETSIYCILTTGKDKDRYKFVDIAIENFNQQTYHSKVLLIINHGEISLKEKETENIVEFHFSKEKMNLGDMRNYSLDLIPKNALWTIWDDDDWRHPRYLELLEKNLRLTNSDVILFKNRLEYNLNNGFIYRSKFDKGMPFILAKQTQIVKYLSRDSLEDIRLLNDFELYNKKIKIIENDPRWYIRTIHGKNTSLYVNNQKDSVVLYSAESLYHEFDATEKEIKYAQKIIQTYFKDV